MKQKRIVLAADELTVEELLSLVEKVGSRLYAVKIHSLYDEYGPEVIKWLKNYDVKIWVDANLHDTPNAVRLRATAIKNAGADILTVHASGGVDMMEAAREHGPEEVYGMTVLTSMNDIQCLTVYNRYVNDTVVELAELISRAGLNGIVCSANELQDLMHLSSISPNIKYVTPGIRSIEVDANDQQRIATPGQAILNGSSLLVIGRQITQAEFPITALEEIECEIEEALSEKMKTDAEKKLRYKS